MFYYYNKFPQIGTFFIRQSLNKPDDWNLFINGKLLKKYKSPENAAEAVHKQKTGYMPWDSLNTDQSNSHTLLHWNKVE